MKQITNSIIEFEFEWVNTQSVQYADQMWEWDTDIIVSP